VKQSPIAMLRMDVSAHAGSRLRSMSHAAAVAGTVRSFCKSLLSSTRKCLTCEGSGVGCGGLMAAIWRVAATCAAGHFA
jgi:hypothetical protein